MKKLTALLTVAAFSSVAVAGPAPKTELNSREVAKLSQTQQQSKQVLQVQAGSWADDYGVAVIAGVVGVAALAVGIVALAQD